MTHLTEEETLLLRGALGLSYWNRETPQRNHLHAQESSKRVVEKLVQRGLMEQSSVIGQGGVEIFYKATDDGTKAVLDARWRD